MTNTTTFLKRLKGIGLSSNEHLQMRERLAAYTDAHPLMAAASTSPYSGIFTFFASPRLSRYAAGMAVLLVIIGGVSNAAEGSVPGDALYSLKIRVNEPLMSAFTPTAEGQAKVAASLATRRIDEAVTLAARGELTPERQTYLADEFDIRVKAADRKTTALANTGNIEGAARVRADFAAHLAGEAQALGAVTTDDTTQSTELLRIVVATSESISGTALPIDEETEEEPSLAAAPAEEVSPEEGMATMMAAKVAATTSAPAAKSVAPRRVRMRITPEALSHFDFMLPKSDVAIPPDARAHEGAVLDIEQAH